MRDQLEARHLRTPEGAPLRKTATAPATGNSATGDVLLFAGKGQVRTFELERAEVVVGRDSGCDVVIDDPLLSRRQFVVRPGPPLTIQDLGSTNGTRIDGTVTRGGAPARVAPGASFSVGALSFMVIAGSSRPSTRGQGQEPLSVGDPTLGAASAIVTDVARSGISVLVLGESGTGKEVLAETLHALSSRTGPLQKINCAALAEPLLESELFGHEKGAFTGATAARAGLLESAQGGTIFLDEVGELSPNIQAKLLRAIESREILRLGSTRSVAIDVRFVAATNRELARDVADGRFRHDLYFRIDGVTLRIPPLRDRRGMIGRLATQFAASANAAGVTASALARLEAYDWPGNVRELKAVILRAELLAQGRPIDVDHLAFSPVPRGGGPDRAALGAGSPERRHDAALAELGPEQRAERARIVAALDECMQNQTRAAARLGISRTALVTKLRVYRIRRPRSSSEG